MRTFVSGATGYIGSRLIPTLVDHGHEVVAGMRDPARGPDFAWFDRVEVREFDLDSAASTRAAMAGCEVGFFLVHGMTDRGYADREATAATNFAAACAAERYRSMVYLSGIVPDGELSEHLRSRLQVEQILLRAHVPATVFRAAVILGAGSTSFELIRRLVQRAQVRAAPSWINHQVQPVATEDVVQVLTRAVTDPPRNDHRDLVGPQVLSYRELIGLFADELRLPRVTIGLPEVPYELVGRMMAQITSMPAHTVTELVKSMGHDMVGDPSESVTGELLVRQAISRALTGPRTGTASGGDRQTGADSDPAWTGDASLIDEAHLHDQIAQGLRRVQKVAGHVESALHRIGAPWSPDRSQPPRT